MYKANERLRGRMIFEFGRYLEADARLYVNRAVDVKKVRGKPADISSRPARRTGCPSVTKTPQAEAFYGKVCSGTVTQPVVVMSNERDPIERYV